MSLFNSPFSPDASALDGLKFRDPSRTLTGDRRASVTLQNLTLLWFNTGTVCELGCAACFTAGSPNNDTLVFLSLSEVKQFLDELEGQRHGTWRIGLTGGEPFLNPEIVAVLGEVLGRGYETIVLTSGLHAMRRREDDLLRLRAQFGDRLVLRVGIDHFERSVHEAERGVGTWGAALAGVAWLERSGLRVAVNARRLPGEDEAAARAGYAALFAARSIALDARCRSTLLFLPEMDAGADTIEIAEMDWAVLPTDKSDLMCSYSRMVVRRRGEPAARVVSCPLLPYEAEFDLGATLATARRQIRLNHPHCTRFCALGRGRLNP